MKTCHAKWFNLQTMKKRWATLLAIGLVCMVPISTFAQVIKITMQKSNVTMQAVLQELEQKSGYSLFYNDNHVKLNKKVSVNVTDAALESVLEQVFKNSGYSYQIVDNQIVISSKTPKQVTQTPQQRKTKQVKGVVKDINGEPIIGASVVEKGNTTNGTITNLDGEFTLNTAGNDLQVSYIGYSAQDITLRADATSYSVTLKEDAKALDEVIIVGYGTQRKVNLTGSVSSVNSKELQERAQTNVLAAIQGTVPGVTIISRPGSTPSINFRGRGNLGTSAPLYVIDGAITDETFFSNLDPNSIESISFLKDASSSSIYGSRAAYGVVLVTTKQGQKEKTNISYNGYIGFNNPTYQPEYVNSSQYAELYNEALYNSNPNAGKHQGYSAEEIGWFKDGSKPDLYPNTNWGDLVLDKNVTTTQHSLNFSGGSEKVNYFIGLGYLYKDNMIPGQNDNRYNLNINLNSKLNKWLNLKAGVKYIKNNNERTCGAPSLANFSIVPVTFTAKQSNGNWGTINGGKIGTSNFINYNPLRALSRQDWSESNTTNTMYDLGIDITPIKGLTVSGQGFYKGYEYKSKSYTALQDNAINYFSNEEISGTGNTTNKMYMDWRSTSNMLYIATAKYHWTNDLHEISFLAGTSYEHYKYQALSASRQDFPSDNMIDINAGATTGNEFKNGGGISENKMFSYFGRINYTLMGKYLLEANIRSDASSRFHKKHRIGHFPSFSLGWRISEEGFMKTLKAINNLKLRCSYGTLGNINNVGDYDYFQNYSSQDSFYTFGTELSNGVQESKPANKTLGWEKVALTDIGVDLDLWNGLLSLTADYYIKKTSNILLGYNVAYETGINKAPSQNIGDVKNTGFELSINHKNNIGKVNYTLGANLATNKNKVLNLGTSKDIIQNSSYVIKYILKEGESIGSYYGFKTDGLYTQEEIDKGQYYTLSKIIPKAGDIKFIPQREIEYKDDITNDDRTIIGKDVPDFTYGLNLNIEYKGVELTLLGQGVSGTRVAFDVYGIHPFFHGMDNPRKFHIKRWTEENPNPHAIYPRIYSASDTHTTYNRNFSDYQLFNADYFRFKTITLGYTIPRTLTNSWGIAALKMYITGENLLTLRADDKMKDFDPESSSGVIYNLGTKSIAFGLNVSF